MDKRIDNWMRWIDEYTESRADITSYLVSTSSLQIISETHEVVGKSNIAITISGEAHVNQVLTWTARGERMISHFGRTPGERKRTMVNR